MQCIIVRFRIALLNGAGAWSHPPAPGKHCCIWNVLKNIHEMCQKVHMDQQKITFTNRHYIILEMYNFCTFTISDHNYSDLDCERAWGIYKDMRKTVLASCNLEESELYRFVRWTKATPEFKDSQYIASLLGPLKISHLTLGEVKSVWLYIFDPELYKYSRITKVTNFWFPCVDPEAMFQPPGSNLGRTHTGVGLLNTRLDWWI